MVEPSRFVELALTKLPLGMCGLYPADLLKLDWNESPVDFGWYQEELKRIVNQEWFDPMVSSCLALELNEEISKFVGIIILTFPGSDVGLETLCEPI